jgi:hypothetical protein
MAIRQVLVDDFDGSTDDVHTVTFSLGTAAYNIDLSPANHDQLAAILAPYIRAGRRQTRPGTPTATGRANLRQVRAWWRDNAQRLNLPQPRSHGAIPARVLTAYRDHTTRDTTGQ